MTGFSMKKFNVSALLLGFMSLLMVSCSKTLSTDPPLIKGRQKAVFVTTENSAVISYQAETGNKLWEVSTSGISDVTPAFYNKMLYVMLVASN